MADQAADRNARQRRRAGDNWADIVEDAEGAAPAGAPLAAGQPILNANGHAVFVGLAIPDLLTSWQRVLLPLQQQLHVGDDQWGGLINPLTDAELQQLHPVDRLQQHSIPRFSLAPGDNGAASGSVKFLMDVVKSLQAYGFVYRTRESRTFLWIANQLSGAAFDMWDVALQTAQTQGDTTSGIGPRGSTLWRALTAFGESYITANDAAKIRTVVHNLSWEKSVQQTQIKYTNVFRDADVVATHTAHLMPLERFERLTDAAKVQLVMAGAPRWAHNHKMLHPEGFGSLQDTWRTLAVAQPAQTSSARLSSGLHALACDDNADHVLARLAARDPDLAAQAAAALDLEEPVTPVPAPILALARNGRPATCHFCGQPGHFKAQCPAYLAHLAGGAAETVVPRPPSAPTPYRRPVPTTTPSATPVSAPTSTDPVAALRAEFSAQLAAHMAEIRQLLTAPAAVAAPVLQLDTTPAPGVPDASTAFDVPEPLVAGAVGPPGYVAVGNQGPNVLWAAPHLLPPSGNDTGSQE